MANVINWLLMLIIFVFDPLAISLVIAANFAFNKIKPKEKKLYTKKNWIDENQTTKTNKGNVGNPKKEEMSKVEKENNKQIIKNLENKINKINQSDITEKRRNEEAIKIQKKINIIKKLKDNNNDNQITY